MVKHLVFKYAPGAADELRKQLIKLNIWTHIEHSWLESECDAYSLAHFKYRPKDPRFTFPVRIKIEFRHKLNVAFVTNIYPLKKGSKRHMLLNRYYWGIQAEIFYTLQKEGFQNIFLLRHAKLGKHYCIKEVNVEHKFYTIKPQPPIIENEELNNYLEKLLQEMEKENLNYYCDRFKVEELVAFIAMSSFFGGTVFTRQDLNLIFKRRGINSWLEGKIILDYEKHIEFLSLYKKYRENQIH